MGLCYTKEHELLAPAQAGEIERSALEFPSRLTNIHKSYRFTKILGHGHFGTVREAAPLHESARLKFAIKSIPKEKIHPKGLSFMRRELELLQVVDHPNIIKCYEIYEDERYVHIVMEMCTGGDLFDHLLRYGQYSEEETARVMQKIISAVNYLHSKNICHRDIKADNFLFENSDVGAEIKIIDFGLARKFGMEKMHTVVGTPYYMAPEVLRGNYGKECDVWSLGVLLYLMLAGRPPFFSMIEEEIFRKITSGRFNFKGEEWIGTSPQVKDLIRRMLTVEIDKRISIHSILEHEWFQMSVASRTESQVKPHILDKLKNYKSPKKLKLEAMRVAVRLLSVEQIEELRAAFQSMDTNQSGTISAGELASAMKNAGFAMAQEELERVVQSAEYMKTGQLNYTEFLLATLDLKRVLTDEVLYAAFQHFDVDNTGFITASDLSSAFSRAGYEFNVSEIHSMVNELGLRDDCKIDYDEFRAILRTSYAVQGETASPQVRLRKGSAQSELMQY